MDFHPAFASGQAGIGGGAAQRHRQSHSCRSLAQFTGALPSALPIALQGATPVEIAEVVAELRCIDPPRPQAQLAVRCRRRPGKLDPHALQGGNRGRNPIDGGRGRRVRGAAIKRQAGRTQHSRRNIGRDIAEA